MAYNTKPIITDKDGNPISQYYNPDTDSYEPVEGSHGANKVLVENNDLSLIPILDKLSQLTGTVIDEETRKSNELQRIDNEDARQSNEETRKSNEIARVEDEDIRIQNENTRVQNEDTRQTNEQTREDNELNRNINEEQRIVKETERGVAESTRINSEDERIANEEIRRTNEQNRQSNELERIDNEDTRQANENIRNTNEIARVNNEEIRIQNEDARKQSESIRKTNEQNRIDLYNDLMEKVSTGYFDGKNLEFHWNGTSLGVRVEGETEYIYVDLKGETGDIENLTMQHVINALGYTPANATNEHTHTNKSVIDKFTEVAGKPYYNGEEIGGAVPNLTLNELTLGDRFKIVYNDIEDSLDIEVI